jgi:hypothetical protein
MSTIKNLVKTFKERERQIEDKIEEEVVPSVQVDNTQEIKPIIITETKPIEKKTILDKDKITTTKTKAEKQVTGETIKQEKKAKINNTSLANFSLSDDFFASLNEQTFSYEKSKFAYIDKKIYEVLMTLKRKKDVKNISSLINAALSQFIEQNKEDIKTIFKNDLL